MINKTNHIGKLRSQLTSPDHSYIKYMWSLPMLSGLQKDTDGVFAKIFEKKENSVGTDPTSNKHLTDNKQPN